MVGGSTQGLGNGDEINIWDDAGNLVDRLTYDDTPRSRDNSVVPGSLADLGANAYDRWELSNATNDPGSITVDSAGPGTSVGSPGTSRYAAGPVAAPVLPVRITEFSYQLRDFGEAEFVELTNVGTAPVNLAGWSFSDSGTGAGTFDLGGLGIVAPGESVVFTDVTGDAFRAYWGLCPAVKVVGGSAPGLGNGDEISIWDDAGNLVDRVTYDDTPRSRDNSVVPTSAAALAANDYDSWVLSSPSNDPGSVTVDDPAGPGTSVGSPGTSPYATVPFTPACPPPAGESSFDLSDYSIVGRHPLPTHFDTPAPAGSELATEVSAITYDWDTDTLFVVGDEGTSVVQVSKTGQLIDSMTLVGFEDTEGISYLGDGRFVVAEERLRNVVLFTYEGGGVLDRADAQAVKLGTTIGNIGLEGISYDPLTTDATGLGFIGVKESGPLGIFQTNVDFAAGTATNGGPDVENPTNLFDPALIGTTDLSDVFPLSLLPDLEGGQSENLLVISQESGRIVNVDRSGAIANQLDIVDAGAPLSVPAQTMEGVTVDRDGTMYTTSEGGGGDATRPQLLVWAPDAPPAARLAVTEVAPWGSDAAYGADWFELTNTGGVALDLAGVKVDDSSNSATAAADLVGVPTLAPGESAIFFETDDLATVVAAFGSAWFGEAGLPEGLQVGRYSGSGLGLSGGGDAVNVFAADGTHVTGVSFGPATPQVTFDNTARLGAAAGPVPIGTLASEGVNGAFVAADGVAVGSPGNVAGTPGGPSGDTSGIRVTEVSAFGSGNSPYAADWFEVTNTGTESVQLTGWRMDDSSATFASGVELIGVPVLPAGASAIFFEGSDDAAFELAFAQAWFGQNLFDGGFFFGHYNGGGVGLSTGGDAVVLFDAGGTLVTGVAFGASPSAAPFATFDNAEGLGTATTPFPTLTTLSAVGVNGAFAAAQAAEIGSPGTATTGTGEPPLPLASLAITEVAPWASGDSPYGSDWIEVTNTGTEAVDLAGYAIDDDSDTFANARALTGVASLAPGASAIFLEATTADLPAKVEQFLAAWTGSATTPAGLLIGNYSGSGIGLSTSGDQVNLFDPAGRKVTGVAFGASTTGYTFDNTVGAAGPISTLSAVGANGAFTAADGHGVGSPAGLTPPPAGPPAWEPRVVYDTGDRVTHGGKVFEALWWTSSEVPGSSAYGAWQEIAVAADGTAIWTPSRIFVAGDVVTHQGTSYRALWWTRNQAPGIPYGPWQEIVPPGTVAAYNPSTIYYGGETVTYGGHTYLAQWWTQAVTPGTPWSSWKLVA
ncbi:MAG: lamin tail domain-containing protein [Acidimicrobiia bacterium]